MDTNVPVFLIEEKHHKVFPVHIGKIGLQYRAGIGRATNLLLIARYPPFSHQRDFVNGHTSLFRLRNLFFSQKGHLCGGFLCVSHWSMLLSFMGSIGGVEQDFSYSTRALWLLLVAPLTIRGFVAP